MISNVTNTQTAAATTAAASTAQNTSVEQVFTPFGELFVQNLDGNDPEVVGYMAPNSQTMASGYADSPATPSTSAASTPAVSTPAASSTPVAAANAAPSDTTPTLPGLSGGAPTAQSVFGDSPWMSDAGGTGPTGSYSLNSMYFATEQTAQTVADMVGGTVVPVDTFAKTPGNPFKQNEPNEMVQLADGSMINAGLVAGFFTHGYSASMVQQMITNEVANVEKETASQKGVTSV